MENNEIKDINAQTVSDEAITSNTDAVKKDKKNKTSKIKNNGFKKSRTGFWKLIQHILITVMSVCLIIVITGSFVVIPQINGDETYILSTSDENRAYEDSVLFNTILGNELNSLMRFITIKTQIETDGRYDPDMIIDIYTYNHRTSGYEGKESDLTARYYLGDLIKWARYGFESSIKTYDKLSPSAKELVTNEIDGIPSAYFVLGGSDNVLSLNDSPRQADYNSPLQHEFLNNRYKTVEGYTLEDIAKTWEEYNFLVESVKLAANDLYLNYTDYLKYSEYYDTTATNIRYCVIDRESSDYKIYTNLELDSTSIDAIDKTFKSYGRVLRYDSDRMTYNTNTAITKNVFNALIDKYKYAFDEDTLVYFAVDMSLPVNDSISAGLKGYNNYLPYYTQIICIIILSGILYLILLVFCTIKEGRVRLADNKTIITQTAFDNTAIELWLLLVAVTCIIPVVSYVMIRNFEQFFTREVLNELYFRAGIGCLVFIYDMAVLGLYYSLIRRIKGYNIWKPSLLKKICEGTVHAAYNIFDNSTTIVRSIVPFAVLLLINGFLGLIAEANRNLFPGMIILLLIIDSFAAFIIYKQAKDRKKLVDGLNTIISGDFVYKTETENLHGDNKDLANCVNSIGNSVRSAVEKNMKDEKMKTELVANVSHDIRTPLTSIINYVDLLKRENIPNPNVQNYISVLEEKSQRLKTLTDDLIEASKVSSGNIELDLQQMELAELVNQALGEFEDRFAETNLTIVCRSENLTNGMVLADGKSLWRVMENLFGNICKYAMPGSRVFLDIFNANIENHEKVIFQIKNMSANPLPTDTSELTERFIRGDQSRNSEGSGLGLSIAKSLTELMGGTFSISSDADLFKVEIVFDTV